MINDTGIYGGLEHLDMRCIISIYALVGVRETVHELIGAGLREQLRSKVMTTVEELGILSGKHHPPTSDSAGRGFERLIESEHVALEKRVDIA